MKRQVYFAIKKIVKSQKEINGNIDEYADDENEGGRKETPSSIKVMILKWPIAPL